MIVLFSYHFHGRANLKKSSDIVFLSISPFSSFFSTVNKHKPWIETSYHGVITENMDTVLLDPPLVALDKDAPVPYAGRDTTSLFSHPKCPSRNLMLWAQGASLTCCTVIAVHVRLWLIGITGLTSVSVFLPRMHSYSFLTLRGTSQQPSLCLKGSVYL